MHFWSGVCAISGALRRKVWLDRLTFKWYPSFYVILVAPPGVVNKSTTADLALDLLRGVPGIKFGPDSITWQSLVTSFAASCESFQIGEEWYPMSAMTIVSAELGLLLNMQDRDMVNLLITLWDGRSRLEKQTKTSGSDSVEAPWLTLLGCTTPKAIAENMPRSAVGGGFTSRCIFIYRDTKARLVYDPTEEVKPESWHETKKELIAGLEHIATNLAGPYVTTAEAKKWERAWYEDLWTRVYPTAGTEIVQAYISRKQTHLCKLAMVLAASRRDQLVIDEEDLQLANIMLTEVEQDLDKVFALIGKSDAAQASDTMIEYIRRKGHCSYAECVHQMKNAFPDHRDFEGILFTALNSGAVKMVINGVGRVLHYTGDNPITETGGFPDHTSP